MPTSTSNEIAAAFLLPPNSAISQDYSPLTSQHLGGNLLIDYVEVSSSTSDFKSSLEELGVKSLRYPGGSVTEWYFDIKNPENDQVTYLGTDVNLITFSEFMNICSSLSLSANIVIPTINAFTDSAEEALMKGTYGNRKIDQSYLDDIEQFIGYAIEVASDLGIEIEAFEIGNEFWMSGKMAALEYGNVAAKASIAIAEEMANFSWLQQDRPKIIVQGTAAAGTFSPSPFNAVNLHLYELSDGTLYSDLKQLNPGTKVGSGEYLEVTTHFGEYEVPTQGWVSLQNRSIMNQILNEPGAVDAIDGLVLHYYGDAELWNFDETPERIFETFDVLSSLNEYRSPHLPELSKNLTEWNIRAHETRPESGNGGLVHGSYMVEMLYKILENNVQTAYAWPLRNHGVQSSSHFDVNGDGLSISGVIFKLFSERLLGYIPLFDYEATVGENSVDVHGFGNGDEVSIVISERTGKSDVLEFDLTEYVNEAPFQYNVFSVRTDGDPTNPNSEPVEFEFSAQNSAQDQTIHFQVDDHSIILVEINLLSNNGNHIELTSNDDRLFGLSGNDVFLGLAGNDLIRGGAGDDYIDGGPGNDEIFGQNGNDTIAGGDGNDVLFGSEGDDSVIADSDDLFLDGGPGADTLSLINSQEAVELWICESGEFAAGDNIGRIGGFESFTGSKFADSFHYFRESGTNISGHLGDDFIALWSGAQHDVHGGGGDDMIFSYGSVYSKLFGGEGDDLIFSSAGRNTLSGGEGNDTIVGGSTYGDMIKFGYGDGVDEVWNFKPGYDYLAVDPSQIKDIARSDERSVAISLFDTAEISIFFSSSYADALDSFDFLFA